MPKPKKVSQRKIQKLRATEGYMMFLTENEQLKSLFDKYYGFKIYYCEGRVKENLTEVAIYYTRK